MQSLELKIDPCDLRFPGYGVNSLGDRVSQGFAKSLGFVVAEFLSRQETFNHSELKSALITGVETGAQQALAQSVFDIYGEAFLPPCKEEVRTSILHELNTTPQEIKLADIALPDGFRKRLKADVTGRLDDFSVLADIHCNTLLDTAIPDFLKKTLDCFDDLGVLDLRKAFDVVQSYLGNNELSLPLDKLGDVHAVFYLPTTLRFIVQDLITTETAISYLNSLESDLDVAEDQEFRSFLSDLLRNRIFITSHWSDLLETYDRDQSISELVVDYCLKSQAGLIKLKKECSDPKKQILLSSFMEFQEIFLEKAREREEGSGCRQWMTTDTGHGVGGCLGYHLDSLDWVKSVTPDQKVERLAVIFEDNKSQAERAKVIIDQYSFLKLPEKNSGVCQSPDEVLSYITDFNVGCFLLDIQNPSDKEAGIKLAERIMMERHRIIEQASEEERVNFPNTLIHVWSNSDESRREAKRRLTELGNKLNESLEIVNGINCYTFSKPILIEIDTSMKATDIEFLLWHVNKVEPFPKPTIPKDI